MSNIRDVAKAAGVSTATVSRVINHDTQGRMTEETKARVWAAIADLNYKAPAGSVKKKTSSKNDTPLCIGCVISTDKDKYSDPYYLSILSAIEEHARKNGCSIPFVVTSKELEDSGYRAPASAKHLDGIILMNTLSETVYASLKEHVPTIVGIDTAHTDIDNIIYDHYAAASLAVDTLVAKGYKRIGFIGSSPIGSKFEEGKRYRGFYSAMHSHGLKVEERTTLDCHWQEKLCVDAVKKLHKQNALPEAFVVASDLMAMAVLRALYDLHVKVPEEVAVMGISDIEMSRFSNPPLTTIHIPTTQMGILAFDTLKQRMEGYDMLPRTIFLPLHVVQRASI